MAGKTSLIQRYITESFSEHGTQTTLSWDFKIKTINIDTTTHSGDPSQGTDAGSLVSRGTINREQVRMFVWDTAGQERFRQIARMYYRDSNGALVCYDITNSESFDACRFWIKDIERHAPVNIQKVLVGLKSDLQYVCREVEYSKAEQFAKDNGMKFYEVSSKTGYNVEELFIQMASEINQQQKTLEK